MKVFGLRRLSRNEKFIEVPKRPFIFVMCIYNIHTTAYIFPFRFVEIFLKLKIMSHENHSPLGTLLDQIRAASNCGLHLIAIGMASALPDICAALAAEDGRTCFRKYRDWCTLNLADSKFDFVTPEDLYSIRCGVLHQGRLGNLKNSVARVIFVPPGSGQFTNCQIDDAYLYGVVEFCKNICDAASQWYATSLASPIVAENSKRMMQYYPDGLPPYVMGFQVLA